MARVFIPGFRKIETSGGGEGGTTNYNELDNKPSINNVPLVGNLNTVDLKLTDATLTEEGVPAEAKTVGDKLKEHSTYLTTLKKETTVNLLKPTLGTITQNGVTCTNNGDGTYTLNGTASSNSVFFLTRGTLVLESGKYKIVGCPSKGATNRYSLYIKNEGYSDIGYGNYYITSGEDNLWVSIKIASGITVDNIVFKPMLTTNLNATYEDFVPYTGDTGSLNGDVASLLKRIETLESLVNKTDTVTTE